MKKSLLGLAVMFFGFAIVACNGATTQAPTTAAPTTVAPTTQAPTTATPREFPVDGEFTAFEVSVDRNTPMVNKETVTIEEGEITGYVIDCRQGTRTLTGEVYSYAWKPETKQELGFNYMMHGNAYRAVDETPTVEEYEVWLGENDKLEWFEQVNLITDYVMANGYNENLQPIIATGKGASLDGTAVLDDLAGVSVTSGSYYALIGAVFAKVADGVIE